MAFDVTSAIPAVRALNSLIAGVADAEIEDALTVHAIPRVRLILLSATGVDGTNIFYEQLYDLADDAKAAAANDLVERVFDEAIVSEGLRRVACAFAASWVINSKVGIIESQQKIAAVLEKQAEKDLDRIVKGPGLKTAAESAAAKIPALSIPSTLFIALDAIDDQTSVTNALIVEEKVLSTYTGAQLPFVGASQAGRFYINLNGFPITVPVAENDKPIDILAKALAFYDALDPSLKPNANLAVTEVAQHVATKNVSYEDLDGKNKLGRFSFTSEGAKLSLIQRDYDKVVDVIVLSAYLESQDPDDPSKWVPGIKGLLYGISDAVSALTRHGPHSVAVDLRTGQVTKSDSTATADPNKNLQRDSFYFQVGTTDGLTTADSQLTYRVNEAAERMVAIPAGSDATKVTELLAQDLASQIATQRLIGAVRPVTRLTPLGSQILFPCLELVAINIDVIAAKVVMTINSVPDEVTFAVAPLSTATVPMTDGRAKSVIVDTTIGKVTASRTGTAATPTVADPQGEVHIGTYVPKPQLLSILDQLRASGSMGPYPNRPTGG